jgi:hypothetical protein
VGRTRKGNMGVMMLECLHEKNMERRSEADGYVEREREVFDSFILNGEMHEGVLSGFSLDTMK